MKDAARGGNYNRSFPDNQVISPSYLNSLISPFDNKVSIDLDGELSVINFEDFEIIKSDLDLCRWLSWGVEGRVELAVVGRDAEHVVYRAVLALQVVVLHPCSRLSDHT